MKKIISIFAFFSIALIVTKTMMHLIQMDLTKRALGGKELVHHWKHLPALLHILKSEEVIAALSELGVSIKLSVAVKEFKEDMAHLYNDEQSGAKTLIWVPGVIANEVKGLPQHAVLKNRRVAIFYFLNS
jgi:NADH dehydrogenase FAD-containing subunit